MMSCQLDPETYDASDDNGTYTGSATAYTGPGTDSDFVDRVCPNVSISLTVNDGNISFSTTDSYPNYGHHPGVITNHSTTTTSFDNNKFEVEMGYAFEETDVQLVDLMSLEICEATPPSLPGDASTGGRGLLQDLAVKVFDLGHIGEYGLGVARGSLFYGVRCTDGRFIPTCVYYMDLRKSN